jgi:hypothetical protein
MDKVKIFKNLKGAAKFSKIAVFIFFFLSFMLMIAGTNLTLQRHLT